MQKDPPVASARSTSILLLDDSLVYGKPLEEMLIRRFGQGSVCFAQTVSEANARMAERRFDAALVDINLGRSTTVNGFDITRSYREADPRMAIILLTITPELYYREQGDIVADDCLQKTIQFEQMVESIESAIWRKRMPHKERQKIFSALLPLMQQHGRAITFKNRTGDTTGAERIEGVTQDKNRIACVVYHPPEKELAGKVVAAIASSCGCPYDCTFCKSGQRKFVRPLTTSEMIAQVLLCLRSYHARKVWEDKAAKFFVSFTAEGDVVASGETNLRNGCQAVELLREGLKPLHPQFIMTTVGREDALRMYLQKYASLPITFYWSLNFAIQEMREKYMKAAAKQSITGLRDIFHAIGERSGRQITVAHMLIHGVNDREEDVRALRELFLGRDVFELKISAMERDSIAGVGPTTDEHVHSFAKRLREVGLKCRERKIVGWRVSASCGWTIPLEYDSESEMDLVA